MLRPQPSKNAERSTLEVFYFPEDPRNKAVAALWTAWSKANLCCCMVHSGQRRGMEPRRGAQGELGKRWHGA
jgi:hypothetical protein